MTVYFALDAEAARVKIGWVQCDGTAGEHAVQRRLPILRRSFKLNFLLAATVEGGRMVELWFHTRHAASGLGRELFALTPALATDIVALAEGRAIEGQPHKAARNHVRQYTQWRWSAETDRLVGQRLYGGDRALAKSVRQLMKAWA